MAADRAALRIGLTGGIGSGKSTVASLLADLGAHIVDTDRIARELAEPGGAAIDAIRSSFGVDYIDASGGLDRARMRDAAFADTALRRRLEAILHPLIGAETQRRASASDARVIVFDVPLLVESGRWRSRVDEVWVVDCSEATQLARVVNRSGWPEAAVRAVIAQQATRAARRAAADAIIVNDAISIETLTSHVATLWGQRVPVG